MQQIQKTDKEIQNFHKKLGIIKNSIYSIIYGKNPVKEPIDSLIIGFFIGYLAANNYKIEEKTIQGLKTMYNSLAIRYTIIEDLLDRFSSELFLILEKIPKYKEEFDYNSYVNDINSNKNNNLTSSNNIFSNDFTDCRYIDINSTDINNISNIQNNNTEYNCNFTSLAKCQICLDDYNIVDDENAFLGCGCVIHSDCFRSYIEIMVYYSYK